MSIDLKIELAKKDYVDAINSINEKYELSITLSEIILNGILQEVLNLKQAKLENDLKEYQKNQEEVKKEVKKNGKN